MAFERDHAVLDLYKSGSDMTPVTSDGRKPD